VTRVLKRPPNGWDRKPNARLGDWLLLVFILFCSAQAFHWLAAALDALIMGLS
jgi:hypothetical protein